jgi:hypothetical protein
MPQEHTATADTPPEADIRHTRPVDDPDSLGASDFYLGSEGPDHSAAEGGDDRPPPVQVTDNPA